ncbi:Gfo/Idh/MocA family protein [Curtobacterium sp. S6]|uniref:Gfo/Idh/MocA family protein n=1 Tax=Curtobacterium sp. S6 TaxID=1479623 RepID=UPI0004AADC1A|nr:Gfo/Idh/MocA family oxidoreductase [Curtobacterium sp. S6]
MSIRSLIVGYGSVSAVHVEALRRMDEARLVGVCDVDPERRRAAERDLGVPTAGRIEDALADWAPDVVHVTTPHDQHEPVILAALAAGCEVLTEKPLSSTLEGARRIIAAARNAAEGPSARVPRVGVCFQNRYNRSAQVMKQTIDSGEFGAVTGAVATVAWHRPPEYYTEKPWRGTWAGSGGGLLINQAIHTIDLLQWMLGPVASVRGRVGTDALQGVIEVEDTAALTLTHESGVRSVLMATNAAPTNLPVTMDVVMERGHLRSGVELVVSGEGVPDRVIKERLPSDRAKSYWGASHTELIRDFYSGFSSGEKFWIDPREALASLQILKAAYDGPGGFSDRPGRECDRENPYIP